MSEPERLKHVNFPKETIDEYQDDNLDQEAQTELVNYAEFANARIKELEAQCSELAFKVRSVVQALK